MWMPRLCGQRSATLREDGRARPRDDGIRSNGAGHDRHHRLRVGHVDTPDSYGPGGKPCWQFPDDIARRLSTCSRARAESADVDAVLDVENHETGDVWHHARWHRAHLQGVLYFPSHPMAPLPVSALMTI